MSSTPENGPEAQAATSDKRPGAVPASTAAPQDSHVSADNVHHVAFYRFVKVSDPDQLAEHFEASLASRELLGSILVAAEGVNGMVAGPAPAVAEFVEELHESPRWGTLLSGIVTKRTDCAEMPFGKRMVKVKPEIVPLGIDGVDAPGRIQDIWARDVAPAEWRELITRDDVVVLDNRNSFEFEVGHFAGAIDPGVVKFRDFADYVQEHAETWRAEGKKVAMYCTGGIRCEKASPWMQDLGLDVYQLEGGILNYFAQLPDADRDWKGECFVFDNRVSLDTTLSETELTRREVLAIEKRLVGERTESAGDQGDQLGHEEDTSPATGCSGTINDREL